MKRILVPVVLGACFAAPKRQPPRAAETTSAAEHRHAVTVVASPFALSLSQDRVVNNAGAPGAELRWSYRLLDAVRPELGLAVIAFPEQVPELRPAVRFHPLPFARWLFGSVGAGLLLDIEGFDFSPGVELGVRPEWRRIHAVVAASAHEYVFGPRLAAELRIGVGFAF